MTCPVGKMRGAWEGFVMIVWDEQYRLGCEELDAQHRYLFEVASRTTRAESADLMDLFKELYRYTQEHFHKEESHMEQHGYPQLEAHRHKHQMLKRDLNLLRQRFLKNPEAHGDVIDFVMAWVTQHIQVHDAHYATYLRSLA